MKIELKLPQSTWGILWTTIVVCAMAATIHFVSKALGDTGNVIGPLLIFLAIILEFGKAVGKTLKLSEIAKEAHPVLENLLISQSDAKTLQGLIIEGQEQLDKIEQRAIDAEQRANKLQQQYSETQHKLNSKETSYNTLEQRLTSVQQAYSEAQQALNAQQQQCSSLQQIVNTLKQQLNNAVTEAQQAQHKATELAPYADKYQQATEEISRLNKVIAGLKSAAARAKTEE